MIEEVAKHEGWSAERLADVLHRAASAPLAAMLADLSFFADRLDEIEAADAAQDLLKRLTGQT
jgi:hypothetical protein